MPPTSSGIPSQKEKDKLGSASPSTVRNTGSRLTRVHFANPTDTKPSNVRITSTQRQTLPEIRVISPTLSETSESKSVSQIVQTSRAPIDCHPAVRSLGQTLSPGGLDSLRVRGESDYYEHIDDQGYLRRRSMMKEVSEDDYLRGRGANPRTGMVSPGDLSRNASIDASALQDLAKTQITPKWIQKGDQWVYVDDVGETLLDASSMQTKLNLQDRTFITTHREGVEKAPHMSVIPTLATSDNRTQSSFRGGSMKTDEEQLQAGPADSEAKYFHSTSNTRLKRKPVAPHPDMIEQDLLVPTFDAILQPSPLFRGMGAMSRGTRSSSAPTPRRQQQGRPDTDKELPPIPFHIAQLNKPSNEATVMAPEDPFLGQTHSAIVPSNLSASNHTPQPLSPEKRLPDSLMKPGRFQHHRFVSTSEQRTTALLTKDHQNHIRNQNRGAQSSMATGMGHVFRLEQRLLPGLRAPAGDPGWPPKKANMGMSTVPFYDNPPVNLPSDASPHKVNGPRHMHSPAHNTPKTEFLVRSIDQSITIPTITNISTPSSHPRHLISASVSQPSLNTNLKDFSPMPISTDGATETANRSRLRTQQFLDIPMPRYGPRNALRPAIATRAKALHPVSRQHGRRVEGSNMTRMDRSMQSNAIGTQLRGSNRQRHAVRRLPTEEIQVLTNFQTQIPNPYTMQEQLQVRHTQANTNRCTDPMEIKASRKCSRCHGDIVADGGTSTLEKASRRISLGANAPEPLSTLNLLSSSTISPTVNSDTRNKGSTLLESQLPDPELKVAISQCDPRRSHTPASTNDSADLRRVPDTHSTCCTDCCKLGSHSSCLGHMSSVDTKQDAIPSHNNEVVSSVSPGEDTVLDDPRSESRTKMKKRQGKLPSLTSSLKASLGMISPTEDARGQYKIKTIRGDNNDWADRARDKGSTATTRTVSTSQNGQNTSLGAVSAARKAIESTSSSISAKVQHEYQLRNPKTRVTPRASNDRDPGMTGLAPGQALKPSTKQGTGSLETPKLAIERCEPGREHCQFRKTTPLTGWTKVTSRRSESGPSNLLNIVTPSLETATLDGLLDMVITPFAAARMWVRNNPRIVEGCWSILGQCCRILSKAVMSNRKILNILFVYSKTGMIEIGKDTTPAIIVRDCLRNALVITMAIMIVLMVMRIVRIVILPLRIVIWLFRAVGRGTSKAAHTILQ